MESPPSHPNVSDSSELSDLMLILGPNDYLKDVSVNFVGFIRGLGPDVDFGGSSSLICGVSMLSFVSLISWIASTSYDIATVGLNTLTASDVIDSVSTFIDVNDCFARGTSDSRG